MDTHVVDLTGQECYYCGRRQKDLEKMQKKVDSVLNSSKSSSSDRISKLEDEHKKKIKEAQKILRKIKGELKLSTIRTDLDAFVGKEETGDVSTYSKTPAVNILRNMLCAGIPIGQSYDSSSDYLTSIKSYAEHEYNGFSFSDEDKKMIYGLYDKWIEVTDADDFGHAGHKLIEVEIPFKNLLSIYLDWIPLMFKYDFAFCEDHNEAREELSGKKSDMGQVPKFKLKELTLNSGNSNTVKINITRCTICEDQLKLILQELSRKENATIYR